MKKFKVWGFSIFGILAVGILLAASNDFTDMWTIKDGNTPAAFVDSTGDLNVYNDDLILGGSGTQPSTTVGAYPGLKVPIKNQGPTAWVQGTVVVAISSGIGTGTASTLADQTGWLGIAEGAVAIGSVGYITIEGYALALTSATVNRGDTIVTSTNAVGYATGDTTPTTGADVGVALSSGTAGGGLTLILLR